MIIVMNIDQIDSMGEFLTFDLLHQNLIGLNAMQSAEDVQILIQEFIVDLFKMSISFRNR